LQINLEDLRRHYASLSDDALREIDRTELVEIARQCYDQELAQREPEKMAKNVARPAIRAVPLDTQHEEQAEGEGVDDEVADSGDQPEWVAEADCVCVFTVRPGNSAAADADNTRAVLADAGIPCYVGVRTLGPDAAPPPLTEYRVLVPGGLNLEATSVLDKEIYNPEIEAIWRTHLEVLTDEQFLGLKKEIILGGLLDRVERVERVYDEEVARRTKTRSRQVNQQRP
jgi:hypothetical protein